MKVGSRFEVRLTVEVESRFGKSDQLWWVDLDFLGPFVGFEGGGFFRSIVVFGCQENIVIDLSWVLMFGVGSIGSSRDVLVFWGLLGFGLNLKIAIKYLYSYFVYVDKPRTKARLD